MFLDRDGTLNEKSPEGDYVTSPDDLRLLPGAAQAVRRLNEANVAVIVITNQRGIALGRMSEMNLEAVHRQLRRELDENAGAKVDAIFHCPHDHGACSCRKPQIGMFLAAAERFPNIALAESVMIGDSDSDVQAGVNAGMSTIQLGVDEPDLASAVDWLMSPLN